MKHKASKTVKVKFIGAIGLTIYDMISYIATTYLFLTVYLL